MLKHITLTVLLLGAYTTALSAADITPAITETFATVAENLKLQSSNNFNVQNPPEFMFRNDVYQFRAYACYFVRNEDKDSFTARMRGISSLYSNYVLTQRDSNNNVVRAANSSVGLCPIVAAYPNVTLTQILFGFDVFNNSVNTYNLIQSAIKKTAVVETMNTVAANNDITTRVYTPLANGALYSIVSFNTLLKEKFGSLPDLIDLAIVFGEYTTPQQLVTQGFTRNQVVADLKTFKVSQFSESTLKSDISKYHTTVAPAMLIDSKVTVVLIQNTTMPSDASYAGLSFALLVFTMLLQ